MPSTARWASGFATERTRSTDATLGLRRPWSAAAPSAAHRRIARDLRGALRTGDAACARSILATASFRTDLRAEKFVSHRYRFVWICNPKVASRSLIAALREADPQARLVTDRTLAEVYAREPRTRRYLTFAFVRNPCTRAHSFYADKVLAANRRREPWVIDRHHGLSPSSSFDEVCDWLNTAYGADAFGERHWLSQHRQIRSPEGRLPDLLGRYESLETDWRTISRELGMPTPALPMLNTRAGPQADPAQRAREDRRRAIDLNARNRALLRERYAEDFALFGYCA